MLSRKPSIPEDLQGIDAALRQSRPELPEDRTRFIAAQARSRARASAWNHTPQKESFLRSRIAILSMLVLGFGFSGAGVGMAVNGVATDGTSAADVQYPSNEGSGPTLAPTATPVPTEVEGDTDEGAAPTPGVAGENQSGDDVAPAGDEVAAEQVTQETRQLGAEQGDDELPFTGFAAIPVLLMGLALLSAGFVLRRRA